MYKQSECELFNLLINYETRNILHTIWKELEKTQANISNQDWWGEFINKCKTGQYAIDCVSSDKKDLQNKNQTNK